MASIHEKSGTPLAGALSGGLNDIDYARSVPFAEYRREILPLDGFIFWIATGVKKSFTGSLHYLTESIQSESESYDLSRVLFTTVNEVRPFHETTVDKAWVGKIDGARFVFGSSSYQYKQAGLFHYIGESLSPAFSGQFVDNADEINDKEPIVSNSLPIFLALPYDSSPYLEWCPWPENVPIFPSFLTPDNHNPPYITVHNDTDSIRGLGMAAINTINTSGTQITTERVRLSLYGLNNIQAGNVREFILRWALIHPDVMGVMNNPIIRDEKQFLPDITILSQKKTIDFDVMYAQTAPRNFAVKLIKHASTKIEVNHAANSHD